MWKHSEGNVINKPAHLISLNSNSGIPIPQFEVLENTSFNAVIKMKTYIEYEEADVNDNRFKHIYAILNKDSRLNGARIFFRQGKGTDPSVVELVHRTYGFRRDGISLLSALRTLEEHLAIFSWKKAISESQPEMNSMTWGNLLSILKGYPGTCTVYYRQSREMMQDGKVVPMWDLKVMQTINEQVHCLFDIKHEDSRHRVSLNAAGQKALQYFNTLY
ncbi:hypothetical protein DFH11DRAFT_1744155 [Phellopilus nigrolimitatus]|nr:hypothetical protein DFH11DRAFT_1744155 [Phellopilus nigrolimitatus]